MHRIVMQQMHSTGSKHGIKDKVSYKSVNFKIKLKHLNRLSLNCLQMKWSNQLLREDDIASPNCLSVNSIWIYKRIRCAFKF